MLILLSPSKTLDFEDSLSCKEASQPALLSESRKLIKELKNYSPEELQKLMSLSEKLAVLNHDRYQTFETPFTLKNARQALLAFRGDVYTGFDLSEYKIADYRFAQKQLRILSGLYGVLRPLDLIQPYRLEMKTKLKNQRGKDLYQFWDKRISEELNEALQDAKSKLLINLASNEYFKAVRKDSLSVPIITPVFKEKKNGSLKVIALFAKQARGAMANYMIKKRLSRVSELKKFNINRYRFQPQLSTETELVFVR